MISTASYCQACNLSRGNRPEKKCCPFVQVLNGEVIVVKNPCLWPGDVRKLTAVDHPELRHHVNTIVFSQMVSSKIRQGIIRLKYDRQAKQ